MKIVLFGYNHIGCVIRAARHAVDAGTAAVASALLPVHAPGKRPAADRNDIFDDVDSQRPHASVLFATRGASPAALCHHVHAALFDIERAVRAGSGMP